MADQSDTGPVLPHVPVPGEQSPYASLRDLREQRGATLEEVARVLEVRVAYVDALERGELGRYLGPGYVRSILSRYAVCLGIDGETLLARLELLEGQRQARRDAPQAPPAAPRRRLRPLSRRMLGTAAALGVLALAFTLALQLDLFEVGSGTRATAETSTPAVVEVARAAGGATTTVTTRSEGSVSTSVTAGAGTGSGTADGGAEAVTGAGGSTTSTTSTAQPSNPYFTLTLEATAEVWVQVKGERSGRTLFAGVKKKGESLTLSVGGPLVVTVGKPEAVRVVFKGSRVETPAALVWRASAAGVSAQQ